MSYAHWLPSPLDLGQKKPLFWLSIMNDQRQTAAFNAEDISYCLFTGECLCFVLCMISLFLTNHDVFSWLLWQCHGFNFNMRHVRYLAKLITWSMRNIIQLTITYKYSSASFVLVWGSRRSSSACPRLCSTTLHSMYCFWVGLKVGDLEGTIPMLKNGPLNTRVVCKTTMCLISKPENFQTDPEKEASQPQQGKYRTYHL